MRDALTICGAVALACTMAAPALADNRDPVTQHQSSTIGRTAGERAPGHFDPIAYATEQRSKAARLEAVEVGAGFDKPLVVSVTQDDLLAIESGDIEERRYRVGITKALDAVVDLATASSGGSNAKMLRWGAVRSDAEGTVWSGAISAPGATSLRVHLKELSLPDGSELWLYNRLGEAFGPYTKMGPNNSGEFWSHTVAGSEALLQVRHRGTADALKSVYFEIDEVGFLSDRFVPGRTHTMTADAAKAFCSFNEPCVENADCGNPDSAVNMARNAVGWMLFKSGRYWYICSGGLLADSEPSSDIPYFLTANHCISKGREADTLETTFFYTSTCNSCNTNTTPSTIGADIVSGSRTSDYTLLQLDQPAPGGATFLGWNSDPVAFANGTNLYRISHPAGAPQAYSEHDVDTSKGTCSSWPRGNWIYSQDIYGATEGGSSGSPVVNGAGELVGQLSGGCGTDVNNTCNSVDNATVDGAFAAYYSNVAQWLGPGSTCGDGDGDGYNDASCGGDDCNDGNASINPGATEICSGGIDEDCDGDIDGSDSDCTVICDNDVDGVDGAQCGGNDCDDFNALVNPGLSEVCDDGFDNDCNGLTDNNDPACPTSCGPVGVSCSANSDCCSNKCRGRRGNKMCR